MGIPQFSWSVTAPIRGDAFRLVIALGFERALLFHLPERIHDEEAISARIISFARPDYATPRLQIRRSRYDML
jgi:hypothetical protein